MASSSFPSCSRPKPRLLYAIQQSGFLAIVVSHTVFISAYMVDCCDVRTTSTASIAPQPHSAIHLRDFKSGSALATPAAASVNGAMHARYWKWSATKENENG